MKLVNSQRRLSAQWQHTHPQKGPSAQRQRTARGPTKISNEAIKTPKSWQWWTQPWRSFWRRQQISPLYRRSEVSVGSLHQSRSRLNAATRKRCVGASANSLSHNKSLSPMMSVWVALTIRITIPAHEATTTTITRVMIKKLIPYTKMMPRMRTQINQQLWTTAKRNQKQRTKKAKKPAAKKKLTNWSAPGPD